MCVITYHVNSTGCLLGVHMDGGTHISPHMSHEWGFCCLVFVGLMHMSSFSIETFNAAGMAASVWNKRMVGHKFDTELCAICVVAGLPDTQTSHRCLTRQKGRFKMFGAIRMAIGVSKCLGLSERLMVVQNVWGWSCKRSYSDPWTFKWLCFSARLIYHDPHLHAGVRDCLSWAAYGFLHANCSHCTASNLHCTHTECLLAHTPTSLPPGMCSTKFRDIPCGKMQDKHDAG
jgi:hypothetical protein